MTPPRGLSISVHADQRQQFRATALDNIAAIAVNSTHPFTSCPNSVVAFATLAVLRPSVVQAPTAANPIVAAVPRVVMAS